MLVPPMGIGVVGAGIARQHVDEASFVGRVLLRANRFHLNGVPPGLIVQL